MVLQHMQHPTKAGLRIHCIGHQIMDTERRGFLRLEVLNQEKYNEARDGWHQSFLSTIG